MKVRLFLTLAGVAISFAVPALMAQDAIRRELEHLSSDAGAKPLRALGVTRHDQGRFGQIDLDGLNAVLAVHSPGHMMEVKWKVALYVDERANQNQRDALTQIFSGQAGGHLAGLGPLIGEVLGVKAAPIEYRSEGKRRGLRLGDFADLEIEGLPGQDGGDVTIAGHPFTAVPGFPAVVAKSKQMRFSDYGLKWEVSNKNGFFSPFAYQSE